MQHAGHDAQHARLGLGQCSAGGGTLENTRADNVCSKEMALLALLVLLHALHLVSQNCPGDQTTLRQLNVYTGYTSE